ncbi:MAG: methionine--tRNA ligase [Bdellovibrionales bacterium]|nr:methionine--tRNA ligase [Bdellovibrionales bacterium]
MKDAFYITTPIYYVNDYPHIGHAYTTVAADVLARYHRLCGAPVFFLTGTDEHGQKIEKAAEKNGERPIELADRVVTRFESLWKALDISIDDFIRTTQDRHKKGALALFQKCLDKGDIYEGEYEGWYNVSDEEFLTETQVQELGSDIEKNPNFVRLKEKTYFFRLRRYQKQLLEHIESHPEFIAPLSRKNEVLSFLKQDLRDLSISRSSFSWGIALPNDPSHVMYVWFDALSNYLSALGYPESTDHYNNFWPAQLHLVGKDILRFHAVFWPIFLMSAELPLPKQVFAHGWWTIEGEKMSKSKGNFVDPFEFIDTYGSDGFRYFLLREFSFGQDGNFSKESFIQRLNSELANDLGNLVSRSLSMLEKYREGKVPQADNSIPSILKSSVETHLQDYQKLLPTLHFDQAFGEFWKILSKANQMIDQKQPWALAKNPDQSQELDRVLLDLLEVIRLSSVAIAPIMPNLSRQIREKLGLPELAAKIGQNQIEEKLSWDAETIKKGEKGQALFTRIETS